MLVLESFIAQSTLVVLLSEMNITRKEWTCFHRFQEFNFLKTLAKTFINLARQNQFIQENNSNKTPLCRVAIARKTNSAFTSSYAESSKCYQQSDLRRFVILRGGKPNVDFDAA